VSCGRDQGTNKSGSDRIPADHFPLFLSAGSSSGASSGSGSGLNGGINGKALKASPGSSRRQGLSHPEHRQANAAGQHRRSGGVPEGPGTTIRLQSSHPRRGLFFLSLPRHRKTAPPPSTGQAWPRCRRWIQVFLACTPRAARPDRAWQPAGLLNGWPTPALVVAMLLNTMNFQARPAARAAAPPGARHHHRAGPDEGGRAVRSSGMAEQTLASSMPGLRRTRSPCRPNAQTTPAPSGITSSAASITAAELGGLQRRQLSSPALSVTDLTRRPWLAGRGQPRTIGQDMQLGTPQHPAF